MLFWYYVCCFVVVVVLIELEVYEILNGVIKLKVDFNFRIGCEGVIDEF